ncbi:MAG: flagellar biosynthesis protein FlhB [Spongiibacteraceae bacterium]|nr:flagellar biosynthesis protein FlhB [Spongiibacteraceae bacterium]
MSEQSSSQDKSEQPSERKLQRSRREGQVARSRELLSAVLIGVSGLLLLWAAPVIGEMARNLMHLQFELSHAATREPALMLEHLQAVVLVAAGSLLPMLGFAWLVVLAMGNVPGGLIFSNKLLLPRASRLNPLTGLKRMFSLRSLVELLKSLLKIAGLSGVLALLLSTSWDDLLRMNLQPPGIAFAAGLKLLSLALLLLAGALAVIALIDAPFQRFSLLRKLRMTKQEVKDEHKQTEGRPEIKSRVRQLQMQFSRQRIDQRVPQADVVIVNPTHFAVAVRYDPAMAEAPFVVAKGADQLALHIRAVAERCGKSVVEVPELARAIYYSTRVDQEVPAGLYNAVAHVLMYVLQLEAYRQRRGRRPAPLPVFNIPESLRR